MIKILTKTIRLTSFILFNVAKARRNPSFPTQLNYMRPFTVNFLNDNEGARRYPKIVGRGPGSGKGKFAARGMKGHKARSGGGVHVRFQGGQTPISRKLPKFGRVKRKSAKQVLDTVNLQNIHYFVKKGILNPKQPITIKHLNDCGLIKKVRFGVKVLGKGIERVDYPLHLQITDASKNVIKQLQSKGGSVKLIFRTPLKLKQHLYPQKYPLPLAQPLPPAWRVRKLSRISKNRGKQIHYRKPLWKIEEQKVQELSKANDKGKQKFIYPVPKDPNPQKIHVRKTKLYRRVAYHLT